MAGRLNSKWVVALVLPMALVLVQACSEKAKSPTEPTTIVLRYDAGEKAVAQAVTSSWLVISRIFSTGVQGVTAHAADISGPLTAGADVICNGLTVKYLNAAGAEQSAYNPLTTTRVTAKGNCTVSGTPVAADLTIDDAQASSPTLVANGTVQGTYQLLPVTAEIKNVRMPKQSCAYPSSGQVIARMSDVTMTIEFNGTSTAKAIYTRNGSSFTYDIAMTGC